MSSHSSHAGGSAGTLLIIDGATVEKLVTPQEAFTAAEAALKKTSSGVADQDIRRTLALPGMPGSCLSLMYASISDQPHYGAKVLSVSPRNFDYGLPSHQGGILLFEKERGRPVALVNGHAITGLRTPAATAVATATLARQNASELAIIGYGEQAARHIQTIGLVRPIARIRVWGRDPGKAATFAAAQRMGGYPAEVFSTAQEAVAGADIVCTVTSARFPVLEGRWISPGTHVNAVGASVAGLQEVDTECVVRSSVWVDYLPMALTSASDLVESISTGIIDRSHIIGEIGAVLNGDLRGRQGASEITLYRSLGVPAQDIELANIVYQKAKALGLGTEVSL